MGSLEPTAWRFMHVAEVYSGKFITVMDLSPTALLKRPPDGGLTDFVFQRQLSHRLARNVCCGGLLTHTRPPTSHGEPPAYGAGANKKPRRLSMGGARNTGPGM